MPRYYRLTDEERDAIRAMKDKHPRMTQQQLAAKFGVSGPCIHNVLTYVTKPAAPNKPKAMPVPPCTVQQPDSIIRPIPLSRLTARR